MTIYLGPVGNLIALPSIGRGISAPLSVPSAVHQIAGRGGRVVDRFPGAASRVYALTVQGGSAEANTLEALYLGAYGPGPYVLNEPWRKNLLSANQSSGTDVLADTTGFVAITGTLTSSTAQSVLGPRSLAWAVTAANQRIMQGDLANTTNATPLRDTPVLPSIAYTGQAWGRLSASTGTTRLDIYWFTSAGVFISASTGTAVAMSNSAFGSFTVTATSPANAALARLSVINTVMGAAQTIYLDKWQFESGSTATAWFLGTGIPRVSFTDDLGEVYPVWPYTDLTFTLTEVGAS
jgi:hypothetical protein